MCTCGAVFAQASWRNHRTDLRKLVADGKVAPDHPCITSSKAHPLPLQDAAFFAAYSESRWADARELACVPTLGCKFSERDLCWDTSIAGLKAAVEAGYTLPFTGLTNGADWHGRPLAAAPAASSQDSGSGSGSADLGAGPLRSPASRRMPPSRRPPPTADPAFSPDSDSSPLAPAPLPRRQRARSSPARSPNKEDRTAAATEPAQSLPQPAPRLPAEVPVHRIRARLQPLPAALTQAARVRDFPPAAAATGPAWLYTVAAGMAKAALENTTPSPALYADYSLICAHFDLFPDFVAYFAADSVARDLSLSSVMELQDEDDEAWTLLFDPSPGMFADDSMERQFATVGPTTMPAGLVTATFAFLDRCMELAVVAAEPSPLAPASPPSDRSPATAVLRPQARSPRPPALAALRPPLTPSPSRLGRAAAGATPPPSAGSAGSGSSESGGSEGSTPQLP